VNPDGKNVILTGATGGIGQATARQLAAAGARLLLTARNGDGLERLAKELRRNGTDVSTVAADIGTHAGREQLVAAARLLPGVDILINNAGTNHFGRFAEQSNNSMVDLVATNVLAPMLLVRALLPQLLQSRESVIINVGSVLGSIGLPGQASYSATKFALHGFSEALRRELAGSGVRVVYLAPRSTDTAMNNAAQRDMNAQLGVSVDDPVMVAAALVKAVRNTPRDRFIGWPERLFVKLNAVLPGVVDFGTRKQARLLRRTEHTTQLTCLHDGAEQ
jgi:short-subunit dehydrogenase